MNNLNSINTKNNKKLLIYKRLKCVLDKKMSKCYVCIIDSCL